MAYVDCYMVPVARANKAAYEALARLSAEVIRMHGALRVMDAWLDEAGPDAQSYHGDTARQPGATYGGFLAAAGTRDGETVVMSWVEWPDRAARDAGMAAFTADPRVQFEGQAPVFDGARLIAGGFVPMRAAPAT
ncbi:DUF1428 domain-containing protein [Roseateles sp. DC23W]|uniref:DUF1428 domain-containing protein n=1 Tax=Pelomonas dachongensis TaxID=3299029 RepID=A0ABW7ES40_9BURK